MFMKQFSMLLVLVFPVAAAMADETVVPTLDQAGRKGEMARVAKEKAVARFDAADIDKDGKLSRAEVEKGFPYLAKNFDKTDADKDGYLNWEEFVGHNLWPK